MYSCIRRERVSFECSKRNKFDIPQESQLLVRSGRVSSSRFVWNLIQLVCWEIRGIRDRLQPWNERCFDFSDRFPVHPEKEWMFLDLLHAQSTVLGNDQPKIGKEKRASVYRREFRVWEDVGKVKAVFSQERVGTNKIADELYRANGTVAQISERQRNKEKR